MTQYGVIIGLVLVSIAQVSLGGLLLVRGFVVPILVMYLWFFLSKKEFSTLSLYAFIGGLIIDLLSSGTFGIHTLALLMSVGVMEFLTRRVVVQNKVLSVGALLAGVAVYTIVVYAFGKFNVFVYIPYD